MAQVLLDADFIIASVYEVDSNHNKALKMLTQIQGASCLCLNVAQYEVANVLSRLTQQQRAIALFDQIGWDDIEIIWMDERLSNQALDVYRSQTKKNISITDCANFVIAKKYEIKIATFDQFYPEEMRI